MTRIPFCTLLAGALLLAGCHARSLPDYQTSRDTLFHLQQIGGGGVSVGPFTGGPRNLAASTSLDSAALCRLRLEEGESYQAYIRDAFVEELAAAGLHAGEDGRTVISGTVEYLNFIPEVHPFDKTWRIRLTLLSSNGRQLQVENRFEFDSVALLGPTVCRRAIEAFAPTVQGLIEKAVASPGFAALLD